MNIPTGDVDSDVPGRNGGGATLHTLNRTRMDARRADPP